MSKNGRLIATVAALGMTSAAAGLCYMASQPEHSAVSRRARARRVRGGHTAWGMAAGPQFDRLKFDATVDSLTGAYNRRFVESTFGRLLRQASRKRKRMSVIMLDVNDFKEVNDRFGHQQGDSVLALIAETLRSCSDRGEIVGRWGGDEFILICPYADDKGMDRITKRIHDQLLGVSRRIGLRLSVSVGNSIFPDQGRI